MANDGIAAKSIVVAFGASGSEVAIGDLVGFSHSGFERADLDINSSSDTDDWGSWIAGIKQAGEIEIDLRVDPAYNPITAIEGATNTLKITFPLKGAQSVAAKWTCLAFCKLVTGGDGDRESAAARKLSFRLTGEPTYTAGS
jgi:hypothetical protein